MEAQWLWCQFPRQIASDLSRFHHRRIAEWHAGDMSSYELLELLEYMPDEGAFKTAVRGGEYAERDIVWRHIASELSKLRATTHAVYGGQSYSPRVFMTLAERKEIEAKEADQEEVRESFYAFASRPSLEGVQKLNTYDDDDYDGDIIVVGGDD